MTVSKSIRCSHDRLNRLRTWGPRVVDRVLPRPLEWAPHVGAAGHAGLLEVCLCRGVRDAGIVSAGAQCPGVLSAVALSAGPLSSGALSAWALRAGGPKCVGAIRPGPLSAGALRAQACRGQLLEAFY